MVPEDFKYAGQYFVAGLLTGIYGTLIVWIIIKVIG